MNRHSLKINANAVTKEVEGGCGVIGLASERPLPGKFLEVPLSQMHNRGNGKGGGLAAAGCFPEFRSDYALHIGYLVPGLVRTIENEFITPFFSIKHIETHENLQDFHDAGLEIAPPMVIRYFARVKKDVLEEFARENGFRDLKKAEDQFVYENSFNLNLKCYADVSEKIAFVLSHAKDLMVIKGVGYAEQLLKYYMLENFRANIWIGHQRYPTRGRVWHPGGAHPFIGLNEALVHNGDFANYFSVYEYLIQRGITPIFSTDTEVSALLFDYYDRILGYDLEKTIEALAPTTERDFDMLPKHRQRLYRALRAAHIHGSPDGPWFFIIARSLPDEQKLQLLGITDTSMLRPHVFALVSSAEFSLGFVASEKQAIDAALRHIHTDYPHISPVADSYWVSRGGSHDDGGAFAFTLSDGKLTCSNKFGRTKEIDTSKQEFMGALQFHVAKNSAHSLLSDLKSPQETFFHVARLIKNWSYDELLAFVSRLLDQKNNGKFEDIRELLTMLRDRYYETGEKKRNWIQAIVDRALLSLFSSIPENTHNESVRITWNTRDFATQLSARTIRLYIDALDFPPEGDAAVCRLMVAAYEKYGIRRFVVYNLKGDRFIGCGFGANSKGTRIDVYGSPGDYLGSGIDGAEIYVHNSAQDQAGQIMKSGKLVIFGDVGQTFLYGAKGGTAFVMGSTAGRPLINSVGRIRAVINGTCLDYAAESFMAGNELDGGFILINGLKPNIYGEFIGLEEKFPGGNFFSLASGGAGYLNDPYKTFHEDQLNGGEFGEFTLDDWKVIKPYLEENQKLFGIEIQRDLLTVDRLRKSPHEVFRKVIAKSKILKSAINEEFLYSVKTNP